MQKVILIGNHPNDGHESMDRYMQLLWRGLNERGIDAEIVRPKCFLGRLSRPERSWAKWTAYFDKFIVFPPRLRRRLKELKSSGLQFVVHICDQADAIYVSSINNVPHLVTCHDLIAIRAALGEFPECRVKASGKIYQSWIWNSLRQANSVICVSDATRSDFLKQSGTNGENVSVIKNALNYPYKPMSSEAAAPLIEAAFRRSGMQRPNAYLFHIGGNQWYKNRIGLVRIYKALTGISKPPPLVLAGQEPSRELRAVIRAENLENHVFALGRVSNEELNALYSQTDALVFPSFIEGFGWPVIEAQACGCPVIASDIEILKEIAGDGACYVSLSDIPTAAVVIRGFLALSAMEKKAQIAKGCQNAARYSVSRLLEEYLEVYYRICPSAYAHGTPKVKSKGCSANGRGSAPATSAKVVPNFFIIGAPKCGTTAMSEYLTSHPNVYFSRVKAPHFFNSDFSPRLRYSMKTYLSLFSKADPMIHKAVGEGSDSYLFSKVAVPNILKFNPDSKFIVMLRNPIDLVQSWHAYLYFEGLENVREFEVAWRLEMARRHGKSIPTNAWEPKNLFYSEWGLLGAQIERLFSLVDQARVKIIIFDEFAVNPKQAYEEVLEFLGLSSDGRTDFPVINQNREVQRAWLQQSLAFSANYFRLLRSTSGMTSALGRVVWFKRILDMNSKASERTPISREMRAELADFYREDVRKLSSLLGRDLSHWVYNPGQ
jgi:glycosyltransferase involved in cell wall biosynthesis